MENPSQIEHKRIYDRNLEKCTPMAFDGSNKLQEKQMINFKAADSSLVSGKGIDSKADWAAYS